MPMNDLFELITTNHSVVASLYIVLGTIILKLLSNAQKIKELKMDEATTLRRDLKVRCDKLEKENDEWKNKFYLETIALKEHISLLTFHIKALESKLIDLESRNKERDDLNAPINH